MASPKQREEALESTLAPDHEYCEVPTSIFVEKVDVNMSPLPPIAFYTFENGKPKLLKGADQSFSPLALSLHKTIWIRNHDMLKIKDRAEQILRNPSLTSDLPPQKKMETLRRTAMVVVDDLFENPSEENINRGLKVVSSFVHVIMKEPKSYLLLAKLSSHDPYTLQHSVGTAVNCIILAKKMGISSEKDLLEVGMAGLLHDIGKVKVKKEIINKNGPLDELEWEEMRQHSKEGYEIVRENTQISERTKRAILEHHEDKMGTGYPSGKKAEEVDIFSKIVCICDVFNALTTNRSYSQARTPFEAFQLMREKLTHKIDDTLFKQLVLVYGGHVED